MEWWQAIFLGIVQGLTEFLPVSSSGHLTIFKELLGVDAEGFLDFTVTVHLATVLSTLIVFRAAIWSILKEIFKFRYNDGTDYFLKIMVSAVPVAIVGFLFKDAVEALFGDNLFVVGIFLIVTAVLLVVSDNFSLFGKGGFTATTAARNGISYWQALAVGIAQSCAVAPGLSRSGATIATGLICGVKREVMARFSFLMVLIPIVGEQLLSIFKGFTGGAPLVSGIGAAALLPGFISAFISGLIACKVMVAIVKRAKLTWFAFYCLIVALLVFIF